MERIRRVKRRIERMFFISTSVLLVSVFPYIFSVISDPNAPGISFSAVSICAFLLVVGVVLSVVVAGVVADALVAVAGVVSVGVAVGGVVDAFSLSFSPPFLLFSLFFSLQFSPFFVLHFFPLTHTCRDDVHISVTTL